MPNPYKLFFSNPDQFAIQYDSVFQWMLVLQGDGGWSVMITEKHAFYLINFLKTRHTKHLAHYMLLI